MTRAGRPCFLSAKIFRRSGPSRHGVQLMPFLRLMMKPRNAAWRRILPVTTVPRWGAQRNCAEVIKQTGATLIHSFENEYVVAGQGTAAMELLEDIADLDVIMCPVGGGGLLSGT